MTLDTQNLGIPCILMRIHSRIYRKEHEWDTSPLLENLALFKEVSLWETCSVRVLVGTERRGEMRGDTFLSHHRKHGEVVTSGKIPSPWYLSHLHSANEVVAQSPSMGKQELSGQRLQSELGKSPKVFRQPSNWPSLCQECL